MYCRKYYLNRKLLLKLLKSNQIIVNYNGPLRYSDNIHEYIFTYNNKDYIIWIYDYKNKKFVLFDKFEKDYIGLFDSDFLSRKQVKKIIELVENCRNDYRPISENFFKNLEEFKEIETNFFKNLEEFKEIETNNFQLHQEFYQQS